MNIKHLSGRRSARKTLAFAAPLAAIALVAAGMASNASTASSAGVGDRHAPGVSKSQKAADVVKCDGGAQLRVWDRGAAGWQYAYSDGGDLVLPGSTIRIKGPAHGQGVLSVNLSGLAYLTPGSDGYAQVLLDGSPLKPSDPSTGSLYTDDGNDSYGTFAQNYCKNIGPGYHDFKVVLSDDDFGAAGTYYFELHEPMVHVELSE